MPVTREAQLGNGRHLAQNGSWRCFPVRKCLFQAIEEQMNEIEADFRMVGRPGRSIFGVPFNEPYKDYRPLAPDIGWFKTLRPP